MTTSYVSKLSFNSTDYTIKDVNALHSQAEALPAQSGQSGKVLTTNGTSASWTNFPTVDQTFDGTSTNAQSGVAINSVTSQLGTDIINERNMRIAQDNALYGEILDALSSCYKPSGSKTFSQLPTPSSSNMGNVYNMTESFTTDNRFVEGAGKTYPAGTNVGIVEVVTGQETYYAWYSEASDNVVYTKSETPSVSDAVYYTAGGSSSNTVSAASSSEISLTNTSSTRINPYVRRSAGDRNVNIKGYFFDVLAGFVDMSDYQLVSTAVTHTASTAVGSATQPVYIDATGAATATTYSLQPMTGATSGAAGTGGLIPAPSAGDNNKYLKGDGTWSALTWTYDSTTETLTIV